MLSLKEYIKLSEAAREPLDELEVDVIAFLEKIDSTIANIKAEDIAINTSTNSKTVYVDQYMPGGQRPAYVASAVDIINQSSEWELVPVRPARATKDFAFVSTTNAVKSIYVKNRPKAGFKSDADPNELMTAALMLLPKITIPETSDEMDVIIENVKKLVASGKVVGHTEGQVKGMEKNYGNLAQAISAAAALPKMYLNADKVYLTGQAWDDDVKQFQRTKYGMKDFNSSDFIVKKGKNFLGVSLKKKKLPSESDPTLINKSFASMLIAFATEADEKFSKTKDDLENKIGEFYSNIIVNSVKLLPPATQKSLAPIIKLKGKKAIQTLIGSGKKRPWKQYVGALDNKVINSSLVSSKSIFKEIDSILLKNSDIFAEQLTQLIFKAELKDLQKVNFDFALVTGIGRYLKSGPKIEKGEYKDIDIMTTVLDDLFNQGPPKIVRNKNMKQAFDFGATAANLNYFLVIGKTPIVQLQLRYKGSFSSAPSFQAGMTKEFKALFK
jgi:hypothetical protein